MTGPQARRDQPLNVLLVEDSEEGASLILGELRRAGFAPRCRRVVSAVEMAAALDERRWDVVLCAETLPGFSYQSALALMREKGIAAPVLPVSAASMSGMVPAVERELGEKRFRALIEHSFDALCLLNAAGRFIYASPAAERILGYRVEELAGRDAFELVVPDDRPLAQQRLGELQGLPGQTLTVQVRVRRKDGEVIWTEHIGTNLLHEESVGALVINFRDITERKRFEQILRGNQKRAQRELVELEHIYNTAPVGLCLLGTDLRYLRINDRMAVMNGVPAREHLGRTIWEVLPDAAPFLTPLLQRIIDSGRPLLDWQFRTERPVEPRDFLASYYPVKAPDGNILGVAGVVQEITQLKRGERALRQSEQRFRALIENSADGFVLLDAGGTVLYSGPPVLGYTDQEFVDRQVAEIVHPDDRETLLAALSQSGAQPGQSVTGEYRFQHKDGSWRWVEAIGKNLLADPAIGGIVVNYRDVTERKRLEEQLRQTQKLESIGVLAGGVAHDFNNLLTGVLGNASLALETLPPEHRTRAYLEDVLRAAESAAQLTRQLLAYSGKGRFVVQPVNLSDLTRDLVALVRTSIPRTVQLRLDLPSGLPAVEGDPGQLQQLVMNLVINAAEAIGERRTGSVEVATSVRTVDAGSLRDTFPAAEIEAGQYVCLEVQDTGVGMDQEVLSKIFDPFFTTKFPGRGLGLSAALGIVRGHHGAIKVHSAPGEGTRFQVLLPASASPVEKARPAAAHTSLSGTGTILVADDEEIVRRTAKNALELQGYAVLLASSGEEALDMFRQNAGKVALVLLDLTMPGLGGEQALLELRRLRPDVKVVLSSGFNEVEVVERFSGQGLAGFIQKPYTAADLAEKVKTMMERN